jgi:short-subunit dehydrogenase
MVMETVIIVGAGSAIAQALCHVLAARGCHLILVGRDAEELSATATDLRVRHQVSVSCERLDALDFEQHAAVVDRCCRQCTTGLLGVVLCYGFLPEPSGRGTEPAHLKEVIDTNFTSAAVLLERFAAHFAARRSGYLAAISSVAGERGRQSNYSYGAAKGALSLYLQGLRNRLFHLGVHVLTIKPGFVDTPMTRHRLNPRSVLVVTPERVARDIDKAIRRRRNVLYTPWFWRPIMLLIGLIPESLFKCMRL